MEQIKAPAISPTAIRLCEHVRTQRFVEVPPKVSVDNLMRPDFWAHCANRFKIRDKVEAHAQDGAWYAELLVTKVTALEVFMTVTLFVDLATASNLPTAAELARSPDDYVTNWGGPAHKWRVVRVLDKKAIHTGEENEESAKAWLVKFLSGDVTVGA